MPELTFDFSGKTALVTGATSGIGLAIAQGFAKAGADVFACGLEPFPSEPTLRVQALDVRDSKAVAKLASRLPAIDFLVNAAGVIQRDAEFEVDTFERVIDINLTGTMRMCTALKPLLMGSDAPAIVNVASMLSYFGGPRVPAYTASKGGVAQLTKSLAVAWAKDRIRVNAIAPGWIATPLTQALQDDPERSAPLLARTPMARWGQPSELAPTVLFLCSGAASFITGSIVTVDGGYSAA
jgi:NAD(P)-dependent dehydrogenase (short-subunit alcohol dehydrogenase family)